MSNARLLSRLFPLGQHVAKLLTLVQQGGVPTGAAMLWTRPNLPDDGWIWGDGRVLLPDTEYQALRDAYIADGFPHGDDGNGNPLIPDARGRTTASPDDMGGTAAGRLSLGGLGDSGGVEEVTLTANQSGMPGHGHGASSVFFNGVAATAGAHSHTIVLNRVGEDDAESGIQYSQSMDERTVNDTTASAGAHSHTVTGSVSTTVSDADPQDALEAHTNVQPTLVLPLIVKT